MLAGIGTSSLLVWPRCVWAGWGRCVGSAKDVQNHELVCNQQDFPVISSGSYRPS